MTRRLRIAGLVSLALHALALAGLLLFARRPAPLAEAPDKPATVELVMMEQKGGGQTVAHAPAAPPVPPVASAQAITRPETPRPLPPEDRGAGKPSPVPAAAREHPNAAPAKPAQATSPAPRAEAPEFNLGGTDSDSNAIVTGDRVIPASPDKQARNRPPPYPEDAARRGEQGSVVLVIHVSPQGLTSGVDVLRSSGYASLDRAARDAVRTWQFLPAVKDGTPVPFDFQMRFVFSAK